MRPTQQFSAFSRLLLRLSFGLWYAGSAACSSPKNAGIHAILGWSESQGLIVRAVPADGPAADAGLRVGDLIWAINDDPVSGHSLKELLRLLRGERGSTVTLDLTRGDRQLRLEVKRAPYSSR